MDRDELAELKVRLGRLEDESAITRLIIWDLIRLESGWRVRRRTNRLLDETGVGRQLFGDALNELFVEALDT